MTGPPQEAETDVSLVEAAGPVLPGAWLRGRAPAPALVALLAGFLAASPWPPGGGLWLRLAATWFLALPLLALSVSALDPLPPGTDATRHRESRIVVLLSLVLAGLLGATMLTIYALGLLGLVLARRAGGAWRAPARAVQRALLPGLLAFVAAGGSAALPVALRVQRGPLGELQAWLAENVWALGLLLALTVGLAALDAAQRPSARARLAAHAAYLAAIAILLAVSLPVAAGLLGFFYALLWPVLLGLARPGSARGALLAARIGAVASLLVAATIGVGA